MRTILDTSTGYGTACVIEVKGGGDKYAISSAVSSLKELGYIRFRCRTDPGLQSRQWWMQSSSVCQAIAQSSKSCQRRQFPRVMRVWVLWRAGTIFCKDKIRALRFDDEDRFGSIVGQISAQTEWCDRVRKFKRSVIQETIDAIW